MAGTDNTKQAAWIAIGSLFSFGFGIVSSMILSRYFDKSDYGTYKQVLYVYHTMLTVFTLGLPKAYSFFLPRSPIDQAKSLINRITYLFFLLGGVFSLLLFFGAPYIADIMNNEDLAQALRIFAIVPLLMLPTMGLEGILATYRKTKFMAVYTIVTRIVMLLCVALPVVFFNVGYIGSIIGFAISSFVAFLLALYFKYLPVRNQGSESSDITYREILQFSLPILFASLWGMLINSTDQFFISRYFGTEAFAEFSNGAIEIPFISMIIGSSAAVLTPLLSGKMDSIAKERTTIENLWKNSLLKSIMLIYPMIVFFVLDANLIMTTLYGKSYEASGDYFVIKSLINIVKVVPFYPFLISFGAVKIYSRSMMYTFIIMASLEYLSICLFPNPLVVAGIHTVCLVCQYCFFVVYIAHHILCIGINKMVPWKGVIQTLIFSVISILLVKVLDNFVFHGLHDLVRICLHVIVYALFYLLICQMFKLDYLQLVKPLFKRQ